MADVCAALDFSHKHNIIHRDVKPANIMINRAGAVKVMDFGIARALGEGQNVTQTAAVIGTAQYLSPEQARGEAVDARSDCLRRRLRAVRAAHRRAAVHRRHPGRGGLPARAGRPAVPVGGQPAGHARAGRDRAQGAEQEPGQPLPVRGGDAGGPGAGALRAAATRADRDERRRAHRPAEQPPRDGGRPGGSTARAPPATHLHPRRHRPRTATTTTSRTAAGGAGSPSASAQPSWSGSSR